MKILIISSLFPPQVLGGYAILCEQVCRELVRMGDDLHVITSDQGVGTDFEELDYLPIDRVLEHVLPFSKPPRGFWGMSRRVEGVHARNYARTRELIARIKPDIAFVWSQLRLTLGSARAAQDAGLPVVFALNDAHIGAYVRSRFTGGPKGWLRAAYDRLAMPHRSLNGLDLTYTTAISKCLKEQLLEMGTPIENSRVIYQGIPIERYDVKEDPGCIGDPVKIFYAGQLLEAKGVHTLLEAIRRINENAPEVRVEVSIAGAGPDDYTMRLREMAPHNVRFLGKLPNAELPPIYRAHDIFVFPSIWKEPFGLTQLEAMASGTVAVCTTDGGHGECLFEGENALTFRKGDSEHLASRILELIRDPELSRRLARNARAMVEKDFTVARYAETQRALLEEAVAARKASRSPA